MAEKETGFKLPLGWTKVTIPQQPKNVQQGHPITQANVVYYSPDGLKFTSLDEVKHFLDNSTKCKHPSKKRKLSNSTTNHEHSSAATNGAQTERSTIYSCKLIHLEQPSRIAKIVANQKIEHKPKLKGKVVGMTQEHSTIYVWMEW